MRKISVDNGIFVKWYTRAFLQIETLQGRAQINNVDDIYIFNKTKS
jgi:hypothetical protein